jgi:hypothetical protein
LIRPCSRFHMAFYLRDRLCDHNTSRCSLHCMACEHRTIWHGGAGEDEITVGNGTLWRIRIKQGSTRCPSGSRLRDCWEKMSCLLIYGGQASIPMNWCRTLKVWIRSQRGVMASRNRFVTRQDHWDLMLSLTGTRTRGTYVP